MTFPGLATARELNEQHLPDTCVSSTPTPGTPDGEGGWVPGEPVTETFACRTWPLNAREMETLVASQIREPGLVGMAMPYGQALALNATVSITRHDTGEVAEYEVKARVPDPTYAMMSRAILKRTGP